jgi:hypothetical protein
MAIGPYVIQRVAVNTSTWTPIITPFQCSSFSVRCDNDVIDERSDPNDASTQDTLALGTQEYVLGSTIFWAPGETVFFIKSHTLSTEVVVKFVGIKVSSLT